MPHPYNTYLITLFFFSIVSTWNCFWRLSKPKNSSPLRIKSKIMPKFSSIYLSIPTKNYARKSRGRYPHPLMNTIAKIVKGCFKTNFLGKLMKLKAPKTIIMTFTRKIYYPSYSSTYSQLNSFNNLLALEVNSHFKTVIFPYIIKDSLGFWSLFMKGEYFRLISTLHYYWSRAHEKTNENLWSLDITNYYMVEEFVLFTLYLCI